MKRKKFKSALKAKWRLLKHSPTGDDFLEFSVGENFNLPRNPGEIKEGFKFTAHSKLGSVRVEYGPCKGSKVSGRLGFKPSEEIHSHLLSVFDNDEHKILLALTIQMFDYAKNLQEPASN